MLKQKKNLCLLGATTQELRPRMRSLVRLWIQIKNDEEVIFGAGRQQWRTC